MTADDLDLSFGLWVAIWGAHWSGDISEQDALLAEGSKASQIWWDHTSEYLGLLHRFHGDHEVPTPCWMALRYLGETLIEQALTDERVGPIQEWLSSWRP